MKTILLNRNGMGKMVVVVLESKGGMVACVEERRTDRLEYTREKV